MDAVRQSIQQYGYNQPIVVDENHEILAGHTRYKALVQLGATEVDVVIAAGLTKKQAKEYRIADNKSSELASWDMNNLIPELREIGDITELQIYFGSQNLDDLLAETAGAMKFKLPTDAEIEKEQQRLDRKFEDVGRSRQEDYVETTCPHCGETYFLSRGEIENQIEIRAKETSILNS